MLIDCYQAKKKASRESIRHMLCANNYSITKLSFLKKKKKVGIKQKMSNRKMIKVRKLLTSLTSSWNLLDTKLASGTSSLWEKIILDIKVGLRSTIPYCRCFLSCLVFMVAVCLLKFGTFLRDGSGSLLCIC